MRNEIIKFNSLGKNLHHYSATGDRTIELGKQNVVQESLNYIDKYATENGFKILNCNADNQGAIVYFLVKE